MTNNNNDSSSALVIPIEHRSHFTDAQAEELVAQFEQSDADGSGAIDEREFRALLARMSLSVTDAEAGELVASIDTNGNGLIDFAELVAMVVQLKQGDARFQALKRLLDALDTTPVAMLEREASASLSLLAMLSISDCTHSTLSHTHTAYPCVCVAPRCREVRSAHRVPARGGAQGNSVDAAAVCHGARDRRQVVRRAWR